MAGGSFTPGIPNGRPGTYFNFQSQKNSNASENVSGVAVIPVQLDWGNSGFKSLQSIIPDAEYVSLGYKISHSNMKLVREALKKAATVIVYNLNKGNAATCTVGNLTVTAKYPGRRGNDLKVTIVPNVVSGKDIIITLGLEVIYKAEKVTTVESLPDSDWVAFSGTGDLTTTASLSLTGGTTVAPVAQDYTDFLDALENVDFDVAAFPVTDSSLIQAFATKIKYFRNSIGKMVVGVVANFPADYEGIINVRNGVLLDSGETITAAEATAFVAGASASATSAVDLTYVEYLGAVDVNPRLTHEQTVIALQNSEFVFSVIDKKVKIEEDLNSFNSYTDDKDIAYRCNRTIRIFDEFQARGSAILVPNKYDSEDDGRKLAKQDLVTLLLDMQAEKALKNVDSENDIVIDLALSSGDSLYGTAALQPVTSYKKYYMSVKTR